MEKSALIDGAKQAPLDAIEALLREDWLAASTSSRHLLRR